MTFSSEKILECHIQFCIGFLMSYVSHISLEVKSQFGKNQNVIVSFHVFNLLFSFKIKCLVIVMGTLHS